MSPTKPKKKDISFPSNFVHKVHADFDRVDGQLIGLPKQWNSILQTDCLGKKISRREDIIQQSRKYYPGIDLELKGFERLNLERKFSTSSAPAVHVHASNIDEDPGYDLEKVRARNLARASALRKAQESKKPNGNNNYRNLILSRLEKLRVLPKPNLDQIKFPIQTKPTQPNNGGPTQGHGKPYTAEMASKPWTPQQIFDVEQMLASHYQQQQKLLQQQTSNRLLQQQRFWSQQDERWMAAQRNNMAPDLPPKYPSPLNKKLLKAEDFNQQADYSNDPRIQQTSKLTTVITISGDESTNSSRMEGSVDFDSIENNIDISVNVQKSSPKPDEMKDDKRESQKHKESSEYSSQEEEKNEEETIEENYDLLIDTLRKISEPKDPKDVFENMVLQGEDPSGQKYVAYSPALKTKVTVKKIDLLNQSWTWLEYMFTDIMIMLEHPHRNILQLHELYLKNDTLWIVTEHMKHGLLTELLEQRRLSEYEIGRISADILQALAFLHGQGYVHRDIKSDQIQLNDGIAKLAGFGFTVELEGGQRSSLVGTPYWMSPEILKGDKYDQQVDIWSLGVTVIEMIDREPPNFNQSPLVAMKKIRDGEILRPECNQVTPSLMNFIKEMLEPDPMKRPTAKQLLKHPFLQQTSLNH